MVACDDVEEAASILKGVAKMTSGTKKEQRQRCKKGSSGRSGSGSVPPYASLFFNGTHAEEEHVTVWEPASGKTVAGNAAPYRRNLTLWLKGHPGWEEKADELKSSKRRSAARRAKAAAESFASLCAHASVAQILLDDVNNRIDGREDTPESDWTADEYVRLEEALVRLAEQVNTSGSSELSEDRWLALARGVCSSRTALNVMLRAKYMLQRGIASQHGSSSTVTTSAANSPVASSSNPEERQEATARTTTSTFPMSSSSIGDRSFRTPREPRITVWDPTTGRTVSGNAAPCKRNLDAWIAAHPGWEVKPDEYLSSSRRVKKLSLAAISVGTPTESASPAQSESSVPNVPPSPMSNPLSDALEGLLHLSKSPAASTSSIAASADSDGQRTPSTASSLSDCEEAVAIGVKRCAPTEDNTENSHFRRQRLDRLAA